MHFFSASQAQAPCAYLDAVVIYHCPRSHAADAVYRPQGPVGVHQQALVNEWDVAYLCTEAHQLHNFLILKSSDIEEVLASKFWWCIAGTTYLGRAVFTLVCYSHEWVHYSRGGEIHTETCERSVAVGHNVGIPRLAIQRLPKMHTGRVAEMARKPSEVVDNPAVDKDHRVRVRGTLELAHQVHREWPLAGRLKQNPEVHAVVGSIAGQFFGTDPFFANILSYLLRPKKLRLIMRHRK
ncbi:hypothetical protein B0H13DRAFT_1919145 [Mycena leptocephala]|nr:hypothetical protein B0H13DRAFT_1919145 [Mycena leptocephala]